MGKILMAISDLVFTVCSYFSFLLCCYVSTVVVDGCSRSSHIRGTKRHTQLPSI